MWMLVPVIWLSFAGYGCWIASIKRRNPAGGALYGLLLGPIGCLAVATLRERTQQEVEAIRARRREDAEARLEQEVENRAASREEARRRREEARRRAGEARARRDVAFRRFSDWFDRAVLRFGWYEALPEVAQPIVIGLLVALPLVIVLILVMRGR